MDKFEEVKRLLQNTAIKGSNQAEVIACEICQLFEPEKCPECKGWGFLHEYDEKTKGNKACGVCKGTGIKPTPDSITHPVKMGGNDTAFGKSSPASDEAWHAKNSACDIPTKSDEGLREKIKEVFQYPCLGKNCPYCKSYPDNCKGNRHLNCQIDQIFALISARNKDNGEVQVWQETVMPLEYSVLDNFHLKGLPDTDILLALSSQAKISYKAGYEAGYKQRRLEENPLVQQGMQKVVEWIENNKQVVPIYWLENIKMVLEINAWQQFLKDNNLEGKE